MKKARNVVLALLCALLLIAGSVAGTLAYLTSTDDITNTFTVGNVTITLDEAPIDPATGKKTTGNRTETGYTDVMLIPGREIDKDPTVHVAANSEKCYLFIKVTNNIAGAEAATNPIHAQIIANGWTEKGTGSGIYYRVVEKDDEAQSFLVFNKFVVDSAETYDSLDGLTTKSIIVNAYAVQFENVADVDAAWAVFNP